MKKSILLGITMCLAVVAMAQRSMEWYSYWGSNTSGSQIEPQRMAVDAAGNIYVAALFGGDKVAVESRTLVSASASDKGDAVVVKMNDQKTVLWTYPIVNAGVATITDLVVDMDGNIVLTGAFNQSIKVGTSTMALDDTNMGEAAVYVLRLSADGTALNAWQIPAVSARGGKLAINSQNHIIVTGLLEGDATFVPGGAAEGDFQNSAQLFVAEYDVNGTLIWHQFRNDGGNSIYGAPSVAVDAANNIYVAASITGTTTMAGMALNATASNAFLLCYNAQRQEQWAHMIDGDQSDVAADVVVSPIGQVIIAVNHHSGTMHIDDMMDEFKHEYAFDAQWEHAAFFSFDLSGEFKWFFDWGYSNGESGSDAPCYALRCTDEGVLYATGMMTGRYGGSRLSALEEERTLPNGKNSGVETVDYQWLQHNTNGGHDNYIITLTREGKLANAARPGGPQYEIGTDVALSPDKKSLYLLSQINVRDNVPYTCPDNLFDSWTDLYAPTNWASRKNNYTLLNVYCPENNGSSTNYTKAYKANFASSMLVKYAMPEINPNNLPFYTVGQAYSESIALLNPQGVASIFSLGASSDVSFDGTTVSGNFADQNKRYVGLIAIDSIALPGQITYYEYDNQTHKSLRSQPRNVRYMPLTDGSHTAVEDAYVLDATIYPTLCKDNLYIRCEEPNYTVNIYAMDGRMLFSQDKVSMVTVGGYLMPGSYQVEVRAGQGRCVKTIIVQ